MNNHEQKNFNTKLTPTPTRGYSRNMDENGERDRNNQEKARQFSELLRGVENEQTRRGLGAYTQLRQYDSWKAKDYARAIFMLGHDATQGGAQREATQIFEQHLIADAAVKQIGREEIFIPQAGFEASYPPLLRQEEWRNASEEKKRADLISREIVMNFDLWRELEASGSVRGISDEQLNQAAIYWNRLAGNADTSNFRLSEITSMLRNIGSENARRMGPGGSNGGNGNGGRPTGEDDDGGLPEDPKLRELVRIRRNTAENVQVATETLQVATQMLEELRQIKEDIHTISSALVKDPFDQRYIDKLVEATNQQTKIESDMARKRGEEWPGMEAWNRELYVGTAADALNERFKRIVHFKKRSANPNDPDINPETTGISEEDKAFRRRANRAYDEVVKEAHKAGLGPAQEQELLNGLLLEKEKEYFHGFQRWAGVIIKSSHHERGSGTLENLSREDYNRLKFIRDEKFIGDDAAEVDRKLDNYLGLISQVKFGNYLQRVDFTPPKERQEGYGYLPESLEATMDAISRNWSTQGWRTGDEYELIDAAGNFHVENFQYWIRTRIMESISADPFNKIDTLNGIRFKFGYSELSVLQILVNPRYLQHKDVELHGDVRDAGTPGAIRGEWGAPRDHPDLTQGRNIELVNEIWMAGFKHNDMVSFYQLQNRNDSGDWLKAQFEVVNNNNYTRGGTGGGNAINTLKLASRQGNELRDYFDKGKQGSVGKAINDGYVFFRYFDELTEHYVKKHEGKVTGVKSFDENNAYMALGEDGASTFLLGVAEGALEYNPHTGTGEIKKAYKNYTLSLIGKMEEYYTTLCRNTGGDINKMQDLITAYIEKVRGTEPKDVRIRLDSSAVLEELVRRIETEALGRRLVRTEDVGKWTGPRERIVTKQEVEEMVRGGRRLAGTVDWGMKSPENISKFLNDVMNIETGSGKMINVRNADGTERERPERIGDREVKYINSEVNIDGRQVTLKRIVSDEEWKQAESDIRGQTPLRLRQIATEFATDYAADAEFEENFKGKITRSGAVTDADLAQYHEILNRRELFGFSLMTKLTDLSREKFNRFKWDEPRKEAINILTLALRKSFGQTYGLNELEAEYAYTEVWDTLEQFRISPLLNTSGKASINQGTTFVRFMDVKAKGMERAMGGSHLLAEEINALAPPTLLDMLNVRLAGEDKARWSLLEKMQGRKGGRAGKRWDGSRDIPNDINALMIDPDALRSSFLNNVIRAKGAVDVLLTEQSMHLDSVVYQHPMTGEMIVDHAKLRGVFDKWWNTFRLVYNENNIDYKREVSVDGQVMDMRQFMFGGKTIQMLDMLKNYFENKAKEGGESQKIYRDIAGRIEQQPALGAFMLMVQAEIKEHRTFGSTFEKWPLQRVDKVAWLLEQYLRSGALPEYTGVEHGEREIEDMPSLAPFELFNRTMGVYNTSLSKEQTKDVAIGLALGIFLSFFKTFEEVFDELVQVEKIYAGGR